MIIGGGTPVGSKKVCIICDEVFITYSNIENELICPECRERIVKLLYGEGKDEVKE